MRWVFAIAISDWKFPDIQVTAYAPRHPAGVLCGGRIPAAPREGAAQGQAGAVWLDAAGPGNYSGKCSGNCSDIIAVVGPS